MNKEKFEKEIKLAIALTVQRFMFDHVKNGIFTQEENNRLHNKIVRSVYKEYCEGGFVEYLYKVNK